MKTLEELMALVHQYANTYAMSFGKTQGHKKPSEVYADLESALRELIADRDALLDCVDVVASWSEGETVNGSFDEPASAELARKTLAARKG